MSPKTDMNKKKYVWLINTYFEILILADIIK